MRQKTAVRRDLGRRIDWHAPPVGPPRPGLL